jgi:Signal peptidase, peptidase S26
VGDQTGVSAARRSWSVFFQITQLGACSMHEQPLITSCTRCSAPTRNYNGAADFRMGDNRNDSEDSRFAQVGFVPEDHLIGHAIRIWMNWRIPGWP